MMGAIGFLPPISHVGADQLRKAGMNVDLQTMDMPNLYRRRCQHGAAGRGRVECLFHH